MASREMEHHIFHILVSHGALTEFIHSQFYIIYAMLAKYDLK
jgi:hypothetical protein